MHSGRRNREEQQLLPKRSKSGRRSRKGPTASRGRTRARIGGQASDIGNSATAAYTFNQIDGNHGLFGKACSQRGCLNVGIGIVAVGFVAIVISIIVVSTTYAGRGSSSGTTTTTTTTTSDTTTTTTVGTTTTTSIPTTTPAVELDVSITCPANTSLSIGKHYDESVTGTATASGGCTTPDVTYSDDIVAGGGAKRSSVPLDGSLEKRALEDVQARVIQGTGQVVQGQPARPLGTRGLPMKPKQRVEMQHRLGAHGKSSTSRAPEGTGSAKQKKSGQPRAPNFPNAQIATTTSTMILDTGVLPPDPVLDVGTTQVVAANNAAGGAVVTVYGKTLGTALTSFSMSSLASSGNCVTGGGDPDVLYDSFADIWLFMELASTGNCLCLYVSDGGDMTTASFTLYELTFAFFPDYPKLGLLNDYYTLTFNSQTSPVQMSIVERQPLVTGALTTRIVTFASPLPNLSGFGFQTFTPVTVEAGLQPNASIPGVLFLRHHDDEVHDPPGTSGSDLIDVVHCTAVDFDGSSATCAGYTVAIAEFNSADTACSASDACIQTPGSVLLDPLRETLMHRAAFRRIPECNDAMRIAATFTTDANGVGNAKVRWLELEYNDTTQLFALRQEGVVNPDLDSRWMPSITLDAQGNALLIYSVSSGSTSPSLRASSRFQDDPLGSMRGEVEWATGSTWVDPVGPSANRWGDYFAVAADPSNNATFFGIGEYAGASGTWLIRLTRFTLTGNTIHRTWYAEDTCLSNATCVQEIVLGDGGVA